jgi:hypothetical protein
MLFVLKQYSPYRSLLLQLYYPFLKFLIKLKLGSLKNSPSAFFLKRIIKAALSIIQVTSPFDTLHMRTITESGMLSGPILSCHGNGNLLENPDAVISYLIGNLTTILLEKISKGDYGVWNSILRETFITVESVFSNAAGAPDNKVGAVMILSGIKEQGTGFKEINSRDLPVFTFHVPFQTSSQTSSKSTLSSDQTTCTNLGLSQWLAKRIVSYKNVLGGYVSKTQIKEVYGLNDSKCALIHMNQYFNATNCIYKLFLPLTPLNAPMYV